MQCIVTFLMYVECVCHRVAGLKVRLLVCYWTVIGVARVVGPELAEIRGVGAVVGANAGAEENDKLERFLSCKYSDFCERGNRSPLIVTSSWTVASMKMQLRKTCVQGTNNESIGSQKF